MNHNEIVPSFKYLVQASNRSSIQHICIYEKKLRTNSCDAMYQKEHPASLLPYCVMGFKPLHPTKTTICGSRHFCLKEISSDLLDNQTATSRQNENHLGLKQSAARQGKTGFWQVLPHTVLRDIDERA